MTDRPVIVLDDDPTGTQTIRDVPVLTRTDPDHLRWAFEQGGEGFFILTNTRSLGPPEAAERVARIAADVRRAAAEFGVDPVFMARGDSTLRGHFPLETDVLSEGEAIDAVLLVPAYIDAGRITIDGVHYVVGADGQRTPVGETEFARDATFGFTESALPRWVEEQTGGRVAASDVALIRIDDIRTGGPDRVRAILGEAHDGRVIAVDAERDDDLRVVAAAVRRAEAEGQRFVYRSGPSFVRARLGQHASHPISDLELAPAEGAAPGGLVVVGSHVAMTTRQLERLLASRDPRVVELDATRPTDPDHRRALADEIVAALEDGTVVFRTSRTLRRGEDADASLAIARDVSAAVVAVVREVLERRRPAFLVAKGGITSSDVATEALGISRAVVAGTMLPGIVSVWRPVDGLAPGLPYVVFAGNVGGDDGLLTVVDRLTRATASLAPRPTAERGAARPTTQES
ncbi:four-carbon acid sugar kinase family protein [Microbacterium phosphatis]|uniref:four-carbon acid sugar kinase family protein n=1 Tax=Microbacterium phosphatis TaxID=3140248 RepID=UPI0031405F31